MTQYLLHQPRNSKYDKKTFTLQHQNVIVKHLKQKLTHIFIFLCSFSFGQGVRTEFPVSKADLESQLVIFNPAHILTTADFTTTFNLNYTGRTGIQKNIRNGFFQIEKRFSGLKNHYFGLNFSQIQSSKIISRSRFYFNYKYDIKLTKHQRLTLGTALGIYNFAIKANPTGVSGSSASPDANIGLLYHYKQLKAGLSVNQFLNSEITPLKNTYQLKTYYSGMTSYNLPLDLEKSYLMFTSVFNYFGNQNDFLASAEYLHLKKYGAGLSFGRYQGLSLLFKLKEISLAHKNELNLTMSATLLSFNSIAREYQINLNYKLGHFLWQKR